MAGIFITVEGPDGAGKTSLIQTLVPILEQQLKNELIITREPGGIPISEEIRQVILDPKNTTMDDRTEALLYAAARRQHLVEKVLPALAANKVVLCDRFVDSSLAYQGAGRGLGMDEVASINNFVTAGKLPDLTLYLDIESEKGLARIQKGRQTSEIDRLDQESLAFHKKVRGGYLSLVAEHQERIEVIDASLELSQVVEASLSVIKKRYPTIFK
ncbi:dTMP kinase [Vagococcus intermedius]|uniref:Thymidylate kinase n=1 Tax=Vagococcus intermedius TaxID=2991418 RepID=A0AAF0CTY0_9ENTE|nr:dTMP kinase [Vagococcus intermedius]WEG72863.1 dTMP kinase [Vagococcus intermedius]WEG74949.1 dTMP kinase [Vagococcus intermedius]